MYLLFVRLTHRETSHTKKKHHCPRPVRYGCTRRWIRESRKLTDLAIRALTFTSRKLQWKLRIELELYTCVFANTNSCIPRFRRMPKFEECLIETSARSKTLTVIVCRALKQLESIVMLWAIYIYIYSLQYIHITIGTQNISEPSLFFPPLNFRLEEKFIIDEVFFLFVFFPYV